MENKKETERTCCGGVPLRDGRCPICGDIYEDEDAMEMFVFKMEKEASWTPDAREMNGCP